jgi:hypothetical protein
MLSKNIKFSVILKERTKKNYEKVIERRLLYKNEKKNEIKEKY